MVILPLTHCCVLTCAVPGVLAVERSLSMREVPGSIPGASTLLFVCCLQHLVTAELCAGAGALGRNCSHTNTRNTDTAPPAEV